MNQSSTAVVTGDDVELWSVTRTQNGLSCLRTTFAGAAPKAYADVAAAGFDLGWESDPASSDAIVDGLDTTQPLATAAGVFEHADDAEAFFVHERDDAVVAARAKLLVADVDRLIGG